MEVGEEDLGWEPDLEAVRRFVAIDETPAWETGHTVTRRRTIPLGAKEVESADPTSLDHVPRLAPGRRTEPAPLTGRPPRLTVLPHQIAPHVAHPTPWSFS